MSIDPRICVVNDALLAASDMSQIPLSEIIDEMDINEDIKNELRKFNGIKNE